MKTSKYYLVLALLFTNNIFAQTDNCISASIPQVTAQSRGRWLPSEGTINVLIVFAEFPDDGFDVNNSKWIKGNAPLNMANWVDQTWSSSPTQGSLTHYFNEMSGNKLHFIGKEVHAVAPHTRDWYISNYEYLGRGYATKDIIDSLDATWNFAEFDNWEYIEDYEYNNNPDFFVDMVIFVWRNAVADRPADKYKLDFEDNRADLGGYIGDINIDGGLRKIRTGFAYSFTPVGGGVTIKNYLNQDPFRTVVHEFSHFLLGGNEMHNGFGFWGMLSAWGIKSYVANAFERYRLGWVADSTTYTIANSTQTLTGKTLSDFVTGKNAYRFVNSTSPQKYFFIENHQKTSYWENNAPFYGLLAGNVEQGIYIIRKDGTPDENNPSVNWIQLIPADGRFNWVVNQSSTILGPSLAVFKQLNANKTTGYHDLDWIPHTFSGVQNPTPVQISENTNGVPIIDARYNGDGKDAFRIGYNQVFSPWSNPNNQGATNQTTPFGFEITNFSNGVYTLNIYVNTSVNASPSKPQNLNVTSVNDHPCLTWDGNSEDDVTGYYIYRSENFGTWENIAFTSQTNYTDNNVYTDPMFLDEFEYKITAFDSQSKESVYSDQVLIENAVLNKRNNNAEVNSFYEFKLYDNYPNPFNPTTRLSFTIPEKGNVKLKVFDVLGREISILADGVYEAGKYEVSFSASNLPSGIYFCNLISGNNSITKKMLLVK